VKLRKAIHFKKKKKKTKNSDWRSKQQSFSRALKKT
jgi:hypothetical protein